ncbi:hypothetical protein Tco_0222253 [Tanacetum coccineum]
MQTARPCFYADFMKCQPLNFKGTEVVVGLTRWIEVDGVSFYISVMLLRIKLKFGHLHSVGVDLIGGMIQTLDRDYELAIRLDGSETRTYTERRLTTKERVDDNTPTENNHGHQKHPSRCRISPRSTNMGTGGKEAFGGSLPKCTQCLSYHNGPYTQKCHKCNKVGHLLAMAGSTGIQMFANTQSKWGSSKGKWLFECGATRAYSREDFPKLWNKMKEMGMHKAGFMSWECRKERKCIGKP